MPPNDPNEIQLNGAVLSGESGNEESVKLIMSSVGWADCSLGIKPQPPFAAPYPKLKLHTYQPTSKYMAPERSWLSVEWDKVCPPAPPQRPFVVD